VRTAFSADDGTLEIGGLPTPPWRIEADHEGYARETLARVTDAEGERRITLEPAARIVGRVVDDWEGTPVLAEVTARTASGDTAGTAAADAEGAFEISRLKAGNYTLEVMATGFAMGRASASIARRGLALEDADAGEIRLVPGGSISGLVLDPIGELVPHAEVALGTPPDFSRAVRSDAEGRFMLAGVVEGEVSLTARHAAAGGVSESISVRVYTREETTDVFLRMPERYDESRITDDTGGRRVGVAITLRDGGGRVRVTAVRAGSEAERAGVRRADVLVAVDDTPVDTAARADALLRGPAGVEAVLELTRGARRLTLPVTREAWSE
jgi:hypothetical protein